MALRKHVIDFFKSADTTAALGALAGMTSVAELRAGTQSSIRTMTPLLLHGYVQPSGTTAARPTDGTVGLTYFDTTLGKPVFLKVAPSTWVDATGTAV